MLHSEMGNLETKLSAAICTGYGDIDSMLLELLRSGGKRLRPVIVILATQVYGADRDRTISLAASIELLHTATLVHDDLVDGSYFRRGVATISSRWNPRVAVLVGDHLFAKAAALAAETENVRIVQIFSNTLVTICQGELRQAFEPFEWAQSRQGYHERIFGKTASLFSAAAESGAVLSGSPEPVIEALRDYGYNLGMAFQVVDDVLDFVGDESQLGKPVGSDLRQGLVTLPTICYLEQHPGDELVMRILRDGRGNGEDVRQAVRAITSSGAIDCALDEARSFAHASAAALERLPAGPPCRAMQDLTDFVVQRRT